MTIRTITGGGNGSYSLEEAMANWILHRCDLVRRCFSLTDFRLLTGKKLVRRITVWVGRVEWTPDGNLSCFTRQQFMSDGSLTQLDLLLSFLHQCRSRMLWRGTKMANICSSILIQLPRQIYQRRNLCPNPIRLSRITIFENPSV